MPIVLKKVPALVAGILISCVAFSQEDAGRFDKRFDKPPEPKSVPQPLVFPLQEQLPPEQAASVRFTLRRLEFKGNSTFSAEDLLSEASALLNREISLLDLYALRDAITRKYGQAGFALSKAIVPEQRIQSDGLVQLQIVEGFVDDVVVEGDLAGQETFFEHARGAIKAERPLRAQTLERYLLLANDRHALKVTSTLRASENTPGASTLILKVERAKPVSGGVSMDNRGTRAVGTTQFNADVSLAGLTGASKTTVAYATVEQSRELQYWSLTHAQVINPEGSELTFGYTHSVSKPGVPSLIALGQRSDSTGWSIKLSHPFIRTRQENFSAHLKYEQKDIDSESLNVVTSQDRLRSLRAGFSYDNADTREGVNQALLEFSKGLQGLGETDVNSALKSRADGRPDYQKVTVNLARRQELGYFSPALRTLSLQLSVMGQFADRGLLSSEECGVGGTQFGRAYDASEILGDSCVAASAELRHAFNTEGSPLQYAQAYLFYDGGRVTNRTPLSATDPQSKSLSSAGLGLRFGLGALSGSLEYAQPLTRDVANQGDRKPRVFASLSARF